MRNSWLESVALAITAATFSLGIAAAEDYGDIKFTVVLDGAAPKLKPLMIDKDPAVCAAPGKKPVDETLVVGKDNGVRDVIFSLVPEKGTKIKAHPDYAVAAKKELILDNKNCRFEPHVLAIQTGQPLKLTNTDPVGHNSKIDFVKNTGINPVLPAKGEFILKGEDIAKPETRPIPVSCSIHPWMKALVVVQDHPYVAISDADGAVVMKNIPVGKYTFELRHETGYVPATGKTTFDKKGKATIEVKKGENDLGTLKMPVPKDL